MAITQALVSVQRLKKIMQSDELQDDAVEQQVYVPGLEADTVAAVCGEWLLQMGIGENIKSKCKHDEKEGSIETD